MAQWRRGSTPINIFNVNIDLREATIYITYKQNGKVIIEKTGSDLEVEENKIITRLTQEETLKFKTGPVKIQIRYVKADGEADASNIIETRSEEILKDGEIVYGV